MSNHASGRFVLFTAIALCLVQLAAAQENQPPATPKPPKYCNPCLFYGGDFDLNNPKSNALANERTTSVVSGATVFVPFIVPPGRTWTITALFSNNFFNTIVLDPPEALWSISKDVTQGSGGIIVADGNAPATYTETGRIWVSSPEYTVMATIDPPVTLPAGKYWMTTVPECTNALDKACATAAYYMADVEDVPPPQAYGREPNDDSYFFSGEFGYFYWPTWGGSGACGSVSCDRFSAGAVGTETQE